MRDVRIVLPDVSSPAAMAEAEAIGKGGRLHISKADAWGADVSRRESELKDTLKVAAHDSKLKSPSRRMGEHA